MGGGKGRSRSGKRWLRLLFGAVLCFALVLSACGPASVVSTEAPNEPESTAVQSESVAVQPESEQLQQSEPEAEQENVWETMVIPAAALADPAFAGELSAPQELWRYPAYGTVVKKGGALWLEDGTAQGKKLCSAPDGMLRLEDSMVDAEGNVALYSAQDTLWYQLLSLPESVPQRIAEQVESYAASADAHYVFYTLPQENADEAFGVRYQLFRFDTQTGETLRIADVDTGLWWNAKNSCRFASAEAERTLYVMDGTVTVASPDGQAAYWIGMHGGKSGVWAWHADTGTVRLCTDYVRNVLFFDEDRGGVWYPGDEGGLYHWRSGKTEKIAGGAAGILYGNAAGQACYSVSLGKISLLDAVEPDESDSPLLKELEELCTGQQYGPTSLQNIYYTDGSKTVLLAKDIVSVRSLGKAALLVGQQRWDFPTVNVSAYDTLEALLEDVDEPQRYTDPLLIYGGSVFAVPKEAELIRLEALEDGLLKIRISSSAQQQTRYADVLWEAAQTGLRYVSHTELMADEYLRG